MGPDTFYINRLLVPVVLCDQAARLHDGTQWPPLFSSYTSMDTSVLCLVKITDPKLGNEVKKRVCFMSG